jgi:hypothetical protein
MSQPALANGGAYLTGSVTIRCASTGTVAHFATAAAT